MLFCHEFHSDLWICNDSVGKRKKINTYLDLTKSILSFKSKNKQTNRTVVTIKQLKPQSRLQYHATMLPLQLTGKYIYILAKTPAKKQYVYIGEYLDGM